ncbi:DUF2336 domain-containing protein [Salaquimonas pukyongi]|uniref:DUF2336 domain-containing protein n=1 Tax=Salaquimonas pukyongi TaxID=2712698 RepID=UPI00096B991A|nr:DUF2336 domain-containing protein [Salaquimonas pukyongi]
MLIIEKLVGWMDTAPADKRARAASALVRAWQVADLSPEQRESAEAAMTCMLDDPDEEVRLSLSTALAEAIDPPRHLVLALAEDSPEISLPVLAHSTVLVDGELVHLIENGTEEQQAAIARRAVVNERIGATLASHGCKFACLIMLTNPAARLTEDSFYTLAERFGDCSHARQCLFARPDIGMRARTLLIEKYAACLAEDEDLDHPARELETAEIAEKAIITYAAELGDSENRQIVEALIGRQKLTTAFLLRAICMGNLTLYCHALSVLSGQAPDRVERILKDQRANAFRAIYEKAGLPASAEPVFFAALASWSHHLGNGAAADASRLPYRVTREVLAGYEGRRDAVVDELLILLRRICTDFARESARSKVSELALRHEQAMALPQPEEAVEELEPEQLMEFAENLAEELAELALEDKYSLGEARQRLDAANGGQSSIGGPSSLLEQGLAGDLERAA